MITIAISIILADQMLREFGGIALDPGRPGPLDFRVDISVYGIQYAFPRFFISAVRLRCMSQPPLETLTNPTPASHNRRAINIWWPSACPC